MKSMDDNTSKTRDLLRETKENLGVIGCLTPIVMFFLSTEFIFLIESGWIEIAEDSFVKTRFVDFFDPLTMAQIAVLGFWTHLIHAFTIIVISPLAIYSWTHSEKPTLGEIVNLCFIIGCYALVWLITLWLS